MQSQSHALTSNRQTALQLPESVQGARPVSKLFSILLSGITVYHQTKDPRLAMCATGLLTVSHAIGTDFRNILTIGLPCVLAGTVAYQTFRLTPVALSAALLTGVALKGIHTLDRRLWGDSSLAPHETFRTNLANFMSIVSTTLMLSAGSSQQEILSGVIVTCLAGMLIENSPAFSDLKGLLVVLTLTSLVHAFVQRYCITIPMACALANVMSELRNRMDVGFGTDEVLRVPQLKQERAQSMQKRVQTGRGENEGSRVQQQEEPPRVSEPPRLLQAEIIPTDSISDCNTPPVVDEQQAVVLEAIHRLSQQLERAHREQVNSSQRETDQLRQELQRQIDDLGSRIDSHAEDISGLKQKPKGRFDLMKRLKGG